MPLFSLTIYWHLSLKGCTNHGHKSTKFTFCYSLLLKAKILSKDHNGESNQWHEWPATVNLSLCETLPYAYLQACRSSCLVALCEKYTINPNYLFPMLLQIMSSSQGQGQTAWSSW